MLGGLQERSGMGIRGDRFEPEVRSPEWPVADLLDEREHVIAFEVAFEQFGSDLGLEVGLVETQGRSPR